MNAKSLYLTKYVNEWVKILNTEFLINPFISCNQSLWKFLQVHKLPNRIKCKVFTQSLQWTNIIKEQSPPCQSINNFNFLKRIILYKWKTLSFTIRINQLLWWLIDQFQLFEVKADCPSLCLLELLYF